MVYKIRASSGLTKPFEPNLNSDVAFIEFTA